MTLSSLKTSLFSIGSQSSTIRIVKTAAPKHTSPAIVPIKGKDLQKDYALTPAEAKKVVTKLSGLHAKRKAEGKVTRVKGRFSPSFFN